MAYTYNLTFPNSNWTEIAPLGGTPDALIVYNEGSITVEYAFADAAEDLDEIKGHPILSRQTVTIDFMTSVANKVFARPSNEGGGASIVVSVI